MDWINVDDKHFVDITYNEDGRYEWVQNDFCPGSPFLVGLYVYNNVSEKWEFEYYLVVMGDDGLCVVDEDFSEPMSCWGITDIEYWCEVTPPNSRKNTIIRS